MPARKIDWKESDIVALGGGNMGALSMLTCLAFYPEPLLGGDRFECMLEMKALGLSGERLNVFFKTVCGRDILKMVAVLRAHSKGNVSRETIIDCTDNAGRLPDLAEIVATHRL